MLRMSGELSRPDFPRLRDDLPVRHIMPLCGLGLHRYGHNRFYFTSLYAVPTYPSARDELPTINARPFNHRRPSRRRRSASSERSKSFSASIRSYADRRGRLPRERIKTVNMYSIQNTENMRAPRAHKNRAPIMNPPACLSDTLDPSTLAPVPAAPRLPALSSLACTYTSGHARRTLSRNP